MILNDVFKSGRHRFRPQFNKITKISMFYWVKLCCGGSKWIYLYLVIAFWKRHLGNVSVSWIIEFVSVGWRDGRFSSEFSMLSRLCPPPRLSPFPFVLSWFPDLNYLLFDLSLLISGGGTKILKPCHI